MTGGLAFEAMNNAGVQKKDIIVILNDNNMSIDANVSAFSNYFNEIFASSTVQSIRKNVGIWQENSIHSVIGTKIGWTYRRRYESYHHTGRFVRSIWLYLLWSI
jgi:deoxyxylulose-5-phosphate synthase